MERVCERAPCEGNVLTAHFVSGGGTVTAGRGSRRRCHGFETERSKWRGRRAPEIRLALTFTQPSSKGPPAATGRRLRARCSRGMLFLRVLLPAKPGSVGAPEVDKARGGEGDLRRWNAANELSTGSVEMQSPEGSLWANRVVTDRRRETRVADGDRCKASYRQGGQGEVVHVLAARPM